MCVNETKLRVNNMPEEPHAFCSILSTSISQLFSDTDTRLMGD